MSENDNRVVQVYNPRSEDFTHTWNGAPYTIPAKTKVMFPRFLGLHLAKHLADVHLRLDKGQNPKPEEIEKFMKTLVTEMQQEVGKPKKSQDEKLKEEVSKLNTSDSEEEGAFEDLEGEK